MFSKREENELCNILVQYEILYRQNTNNDCRFCNSKRLSEREKETYIREVENKVKFYLDKLNLQCDFYRRSFPLLHPSPTSKIEGVKYEN